MKNNRKAVWLLNVTTVLFWASLYVYVPYLSPYLNHMGIIASAIGYITSSYGVAMLMSRIPIGVIGDWFGRQKGFVLLGILFAGISAVGMQAMENAYVIMSFRFLSGVAAATWVSFVTLYSSYFETIQTTQAVASLNMYASLGRVFASCIGAAAAEFMGYRGAFLAGGILGGMALIAGFFVTDIQRTSPEKMQILELIQVGKEKSLICASLFGAVLQMIAYATTYTFTNTLAEKLGAGQLELGVLQAIISVAGVLAPMILSAPLASRIEERKVLSASFIALAISQAIFPHCNSFLLLYGAQFLSGMGLGLAMIPLMSLSIRHIRMEKRSTAMGYFQAVYSLGLTAGPLIMGYLVQYTGYVCSYHAISLLAAIAAVLSYFIFKDSGGSTIRK